DRLGKLGPVLADRDELDRRAGAEHVRECFAHEEVVLRDHHPQPARHPLTIRGAARAVKRGVGLSPRAMRLRASLPRPVAGRDAAITMTAGVLAASGARDPLAPVNPLPPRIRAAVHRPRLLSALQGAPLILAVAPAGYGKTSLLSEWC